MAKSRKPSGKKPAANALVQVETEIVEKKYPGWRSIGSTFSAGGTDFWGREAPSNFDLLKAFNDIVYANVTLIANTMAAEMPRLYVKTDTTHARPKCVHSPISIKHYKEIARTKRLAFNTRIHEVLSHPSIDLLERGSKSHNRIELFALTQIYLDIVGNAFWYVPINKLDGLPDQVFMLPPWLMEPIRGDKGTIVGWKYNDGSQHGVMYTVDEIIHFKGYNITDPYGLGFSPLQAAWNRVALSAKELGYLDAVLSNQGRPDAILAPTQPSGGFESERLAKEFEQRYRGAGSGGIMILDSSYQFTPLNYRPRDLAELELYKVLKTTICNVFHVPPDIWEPGNANRSSIEAAHYSLAVHCIKPRMAYFVEKLNERLIPLYDRGDGRLFFEAPSVVPEDKEFLLRERQMLMATNTVTRDELRQEYGYESAEWAKEPLNPPGSVPAIKQEQDKSGLSPALAQLQGMATSGQVTREQAIANVQLTYGYSRDVAETLFPESPVQAPESPPIAPPADPEPTPQPEPRTLSFRRKALQVPDVRQQTEYDCGPSSVMSVCQFYGVGPESEEDYIEALGTTEESGTPPDAIVAYLESVGLKAEAKGDLGINDLAKSVKKGMPVLAPIQDYEDQPSDIANERAGHWVVITDANAETVTFQDPAGGVVEMPALEFLGRWEDTDGEKELVHYGISVGRKPKSKGPDCECKDEDHKCECVEEKCGGAGGKPGPCPEGGAGAKPEASHALDASKIPASPAEATKEASTVAKTWMAKVKNMPKAAKEWAVNKVKTSYNKLEKRYGKAWAVTIVGCGILAFPAPGGMIAPLALTGLAHLHMKLTGKSGGPIDMQRAFEIAQEFVAQIVDEMKDAPVTDEERAQIENLTKESDGR